ncbi:PKD domain-containing protein [Streptacidiphilus rugosus]|uniref:PKD domain-containing protein n=1 Tax=Streptacidiphilus rugosus TaxID=405783 RepID=UPI000561F058|nr:PKD domain-containing protein [Streptacidiphilus rugosus]
MSRSRAAGLAALTLLAAGVVLPQGTAAADTSTRYVDISSAACSDTAAGTGTQAAPYCTIQAATDAARPGDTVQIVRGAYPATTITASGTPAAPITVTADGEVTLPQLALQGVHDVSLQRFQLGPTAGGLEVKDSSAITLDFLYISDNLSFPGLEVSGQSSDVTLSHSFVSVGGDASVKVDPGVRHTVITTDIIGSQTNVGTGVLVDGAVDTDVTSNDIELVRHALTAEGGSVGLSIENNAVAASDIEVGADSAGQATTDYNLFYPVPGAPLYDWAGTPYSTLTGFRAASGQGGHDLVAEQELTVPRPAEGSPGVDSADADAPGELATDYEGSPRVDDPLVGNTGAGIGYYDRGAIERRDPLSLGFLDAQPGYTEVGHPVTATMGDSNPWGTTVARTFDFGDGSPVVHTNAASAQHTYATLVGGRSTTYTITETEDGRTFKQPVTINPPGPMTDAMHATQQDTNASLSVTMDDTGSGSPFEFTSCTLDFGDGTPAAREPGGCWGAHHTYAKPGTYTIGNTLTDAGGRTATASTSITVGPVFVPVGPVRLLDTRSGTGAPKARVGSGGVIRLRVNGAAGIASASSVLLNLTVTGPAGNGFVTAYPDGRSRPTASSLNYRPGQTVANLVDVPVGADGIVDLYSSAGPLDLVADAEGYNTVTPSGNGTLLTNDVTMWGQFHPVLDTRGNGLPKLGKVGPGKSVTFPALQTQNTGSPEYGATAVLLSVTETDATANSFVTAYRPGQSLPNASNLNFSAGETRSTTVVAPVDAQGRVSLYNRAGSVDLIASVEGFYQRFGHVNIPVYNKPMFPVTPARVLDTRSGLGAPKSAAGPGNLRFKVAGVAGIPAGATGVLVNVTAVDSSANGFLAIGGDLTYMPSASALNYMRGQITPVLVYLPIAHGYAQLYHPYGYLNVVADVEAYSTN